VCRDYDAIEKTVPFGFDAGERGEKAGEVIKRRRWLADPALRPSSAGVVGVDRIAPVEVMGREVIAAAAERAPAR
jgi:hypothetical protein